MASPKKRSDSVMKIKPTIFPLGFSIGQVESSIVIVDFIDEINGIATIVESIALPKEKAAQLSAALADLIENDSPED